MEPSEEEVEFCKLRAERDAIKSEMSSLAAELSKTRVYLDQCTKRNALAISLIMALDKQPQKFLTEEVKNAIRAWKRRGYG